MQKSNHCFVTIPSPTTPTQPSPSILTNNTAQPPPQPPARFDGPDHSSARLLPHPPSTVPCLWAMGSALVAACCH
jgi:hypothetical protein